MTNSPKLTAYLPVLPKPAILFLCAIFLAACGGGGGATPSGQENSPQISGKLNYKATPGEIVMLHAQDSADQSTTITYQWNQMDGAQVLLSDARDRNASFVMPPIGENKDLTFVVDARHGDGHVVSEMHTVTATMHMQPKHQPPAVTAQYVVFTADKDLDNRVDLYLAMLDGSAVYRLNDPLVPGGQILEYKISPDRRYVAYRAVQDTDNVVELYVARADGSGVVKVSPSLPANGDIYDFAWSPDNSRLAYRSDQYTDYMYELFTSRVDGTSNARVSGPLVTGGNVESYSWAPDGSRIAYTADQNTNNVTELFASRPDGTGNVRISGPLVAGGSVYNYVWAPDSSRIAYIARQFTTRTAELFTSYPDGSGNIRVSHILPSDNDFLNGDIQWAPDSSRLAYRSYFDYYYSSGSYYVYYYAQNIYSTRPDGTGATQVSAVPRVYNEYRYIGQYDWAPNSSRIAYSAEQNTDNIVELFTSGPDGSGNVRVSGSLVAGGSVDSYNFAWAPDSSRIAYRADQLTDNIYELFTSDPIGNGNVRVSGSLATNGNVYNFSWSPDSRYLAYMANQLSNDVFELYTAAPDGSLNPRVSGPMPYNGDVQGFVWSADATRLVYRADQLVDDQFELFVAAPDGNAVNTNISGTMTANGDVFSFMTQ